jgi:hypothetical protein
VLTARGKGVQVFRSKGRDRNFRMAKPPLGESNGFISSAILQFSDLQFRSSTRSSTQRSAAEGKVHRGQNGAQHKQKRHHAGPKSRSQGNHPQQNRYGKNCPKHSAPPECVVTVKTSMPGLEFVTS